MHYLLLLPLAALIAWIWWGNTTIQLHRFSVRGPKGWDGFRIAQISDLHNTPWGDKLLAPLRQAKPDIIVLTGDFIDSRHPHPDISLELLREAVKLAPCYYVPGNHEARDPGYAALKDGLLRLGITVLENRRVILERGGTDLALLGIKDPCFTEKRAATHAAAAAAELKPLVQTGDEYRILLSHRPELFDVYSDMDLVFTGHTHGGQFRLPFIGGLFAPYQGFFPKYDAGLFTRGRTQMLVSRGTGSSPHPFRLNNRPEIILAELRYFE